MIATTIVGMIVPVVAAQETVLLRNDAPVDDAIEPFRRNVTHFTYDVAGSTAGFDWLRSEIEINVAGNGHIWHSVSQYYAWVYCGPDPNDDYVVHDLDSPHLVFNAMNNRLAPMYDTFFTAPGLRFAVDPQFDSPGGCIPCETCADDPPIVSTPTRIRGRNAMNEEIPLVWYDTIDAPLNNTVLARLTFQVPEGFGDLVVNPTDTTGRQLFATIRGRIWSTENAEGVPYSFDIWQTPEPASATLALFALIAVGGSRRSRR